MKFLLLVSSIRIVTTCIILYILQHFTFCNFTLHFATLHFATLRFAALLYVLQHFTFCGQTAQSEPDLIPRSLLMYATTLVLSVAIRTTWFSLSVGIFSGPVRQPLIPESLCVIDFLEETRCHLL